MKTLTFAPVNLQHNVRTESTLLQAMVDNQFKVQRACGGKGLCATCHVFIKAGKDKLSPLSEREKRTLSLVTGCSVDSRLACQARVLGDGVVVNLPDGTYIERAEDLMTWLGKRAETNILHPINGSVLVAQGKIITKSRIAELQSLHAEVEAMKKLQ